MPYKLTISVVGTKDEAPMFSNDLKYENLDYGDVVLIEEKLLSALNELNNVAKEKGKAKK